MLLPVVFGVFVIAFDVDAADPLTPPCCCRPNDVTLFLRSILSSTHSLVHKVPASTTSRIGVVDHRVVYNSTTTVP